MVFNNTFYLIIVFAIFVWLIAISVVLYRLTKHYNRLIGSSSKSTLKSVLDSILDEKTEIKKHLRILEKEIRIIEENAKFHVQRVGIVRFNPFLDTGGNQSFTFALLDGDDNGIVMTSLYARTGNRWYIKHVTGGKGESIELSKEEKSAIHKAKKI
ncbi:DUF4446 family protein [Patescibacteria group bacterium]